MSASHPSLDRARSVHADILAAQRGVRQAHHELARLLRSLADEGLHRVLGYASLGEYAETWLDLPRRTVRELLPLARSLSDLPALDAAFAAGEVSWCKAREVARVATPETDAAWVAFAAANDARRVEKAVSTALIGEPPPAAPPDPDKLPARQRVQFMMEASDAELLRRALASMRHQTGEDQDGPALAALAARYLADAAKEEDGPTGAPYQIILEACPKCGDVSAPDHEVSDTVVSEALCDAEVVDLRPGPDHGKATKAIPDRVRRAVLARDRGCCVVPGCTNRGWIHLHHEKERCKGGKHTIDNLVTLCSVHHRMDHDGTIAIFRDQDGIRVVERADGTRQVIGRATTHVGRAGERAATHVGRREAGSE